MQRHAVRRDRLAKKQNGLCFYCGVTLTPAKATNHLPTDASIDHVVPQHHGGTNSPDNMVVACCQCNGAKGDSPVAVFLARGTKDERTHLWIEQVIARAKSLHQRSHT
jgi:5-methylcytosine-specific restriction endonuclease McrA